MTITARNSQLATRDSALLSVRGLCKYYPVFSKGLLRRQTGVIRACADVTFDLMPGETLGLVGESGSGKTTTGRAILRAIRPTAGEVLYQTRGEGQGARGEGTYSLPLAPRPYLDLARLHDRELKPLRTEMQMIFQDPFSSLNPRMTVQQIVSEPLVIHRLASGGELEDRVVAILRRVGIRPEYRNRYPHAFSGGQRQRIGIARALILRPRLVVADEAVSALDVSVQAQVINLLHDLQDEFDLTYIFIAHDLSVVRHICDRVAVMYAGRIVELAETEELFEAPKHPYTRMLLSAVPQPDPDLRMGDGRWKMGDGKEQGSPSAISHLPSPLDYGEPADLAKLPGGCAFHPRCPECFERCRREVPELIEPETDRRREGETKGRRVACHLYDEDEK